MTANIQILLRAAIRYFFKVQHIIITISSIAFFNHTLATPHFFLNQTQDNIKEAFNDVDGIFSWKRGSRDRKIIFLKRGYFVEYNINNHSFSEGPNSLIGCKYFEQIARARDGLFQRPDFVFNEQRSASEKIVFLKKDSEGQIHFGEMTANTYDKRPTVGLFTDNDYWPNSQKLLSLVGGYDNIKTIMQVREHPDMDRSPKKNGSNEPLFFFLKDHAADNGKYYQRVVIYDRKNGYIHRPLALTQAFHHPGTPSSHEPPGFIDFGVFGKQQSASSGSSVYHYRHYLFMPKSAEYTVYDRSFKYLHTNKFSFKKAKSIQKEWGTKMINALRSVPK